MIFEIFHLSIVEFVLCFFSFSLIFYYLKNNFGYWKTKGVPYDSPIPIFGNFYKAFTFKQNITSYFEDQYQKTTEKFFGLYIFHRPYLLIRDPELVKHVLVKDFNKFILRSASETHKDDLLSQYNLFSMKSADDWRFLRSKISPIFSTGKLRKMFPLLIESGKNLNVYLKSIENQSIEAKVLCRKYTNDSIMSTVFGIETNSFLGQETEFDRASKKVFAVNFRRGMELMCIFFVPAVAKFFRLQGFSKEGSDFFRGVFWTTVRNRKENDIHRPDLIEALMTLQDKGTLEETTDGSEESTDKGLENASKIKFEGDILVAQVALFYAAGLDTSSAAMSFTLYFLANNPDIQVKLRKEIQIVMSKNEDQITYESLADMKYLDQCVKETLRLFPTLGYLDREVVETYTFPGTNLTIEKGTPIIISLTGLQKDANYFENPEVYNPDRFSDENKHNIPQYVYLPFGDGPRNCVGMRLGLMMTKLGLIHILKDYEVVGIEKDPQPLELDPRGFFTSVKNGVYLKFVAGIQYTK